MAHRSDADYIQNERNTARFFVENRQISGILLLATVALGIYGYTRMPKRKDPDIPVRVASVITQWPGATTEQVELCDSGRLNRPSRKKSRHTSAEGRRFRDQVALDAKHFDYQVQLSDSVKDSKKNSAI